MQTQNSPEASTLATFGPRLTHMRRRNPYFGALCDNLDEIDDKIATLSRVAAGRPSRELQRLEQKRQNYLATIEFMLEDETAARAA